MSISGNTDKPSQHIGVYKGKEIIHDMFLQNGNKDRLMAHIRHKAAQHGWTWTMRDEFMDYIKKRGPDNVNVSHMIADLAPLGRELFPSELKKELVETMVEVTKSYFTIDDSVTPITDPDNANSEAEKTFLYQSRDVKPDPGLGVGVEIPDSPPPSPPSPPSTNSASTPRKSPGPVTATATTRQSPVQNNPRQSPGAASRQSPVSATPRPLTPQPPPPPPVLRPETVSTPKVEPAVKTDVEDEEEEPEDEDDDDEDGRNNEEDEEDELMDV